MKDTTRKSYLNGKRWGKKTIIANYREFGRTGIGKCDKASETCHRYSTDKKLTKTKKGKPLTANTRSLYAGIADGMLEGYNDIMDGKI